MRTRGWKGISGPRVGEGIGAKLIKKLLGNSIVQISSSNNRRSRQAGLGDQPEVDPKTLWYHFLSSELSNDNTNSLTPCVLYAQHCVCWFEKRKNELGGTPTTTRIGV